MSGADLDAGGAGVAGSLPRLAGERFRTAWAVGYLSASGPAEPGMWTRWQAQVVVHAHCLGLPLLHVYSDHYACQATGGASTAAPVDGLAGMLSAVRELAHARSGHVGAVVVPSLEHLSPARDGSEQIVAMLLGLHLGVTVLPAGYLKSSCSGAGFSSRTQEPSCEVLLRPDHDSVGSVSVPGLGRADPWTRPERVRAGLAFGDLLHGIHGDPDRVPVWVPSHTPAGPC